MRLSTKNLDRFSRAIISHKFLFLGLMCPTTALSTLDFVSLDANHISIIFDICNEYTKADWASPGKIRGYFENQKLVFENLLKEHKMQKEVLGWLTGFKVVIPEFVEFASEVINKDTITLEQLQAQHKKVNDYLLKDWVEDILLVLLCVVFFFDIATYYTNNSLFY